MGLADYFSTSTVNYFNSAEKKREAWEYENCFEGEKEEMLDIYQKKVLNI